MKWSFVSRAQRTYNHSGVSWKSTRSLMRRMNCYRKLPMITLFATTSLLSPQSFFGTCHFHSFFRKFFFSWNSSIVGQGDNDIKFRAKGRSGKDSWVVVDDV